MWPVTGSCLLLYQVKDDACITLKTNRLLFYLLWTEGFIVIETSIDCLRVIVRHLPERVLDDDWRVCSYPNFKKQGVHIIVPVNEIRVSCGSPVPSFILHEGIVSSEIHRHRRSIVHALRYQFSRNLHDYAALRNLKYTFRIFNKPLRLHRMHDPFFIIVCFPD